MFFPFLSGLNFTITEVVCIPAMINHVFTQSPFVGTAGNSFDFVSRNMLLDFVSDL